MVGDGHVLVAVRAGRLRHFFDCVPAVGFHCVHMHIALNVRCRDQARKLVLGGSIDLAEIFAHFGRDVVEIQLGVDFLFGRSRDGFSAFKFRQAVLA